MSTPSDFRLKHVGDIEGFAVWLVDGKAIRDKLDIDFTDGAEPSTSPYVPPGELWVDAAAEPEIEFVLAYLLEQHHSMRQDGDREQAAVNALDAEQSARDCPHGNVHLRQLELLPIHQRIAPPQTTAWLVDGELVRSCIDTEFIEGGNDLVYDFVPSYEIWVDDLFEIEADAIMLHELTERYYMAQGMDYPQAHELANLSEQSFRRSAGYEDEGFVGQRWGRAGSSILFTDGERVLLLHRSASVEEPGTWGIPGGAISVDRGRPKDALASAKQEAREELGRLPKHRVVDQYVYQEPSGFRYTTFIALVDPSETERPFRLNWENDDYSWFALDELLHLDLHFGVQALLAADKLERRAAVQDDLFAEFEETARSLETELTAHNEPTERSRQLERKLDELGSALGFCDLDPVADTLIKMATDIDTVHTAGKRQEDPRRRYKGVCVRPEKRLALYLRDRFTCAYCGKDLHSEPADITLDHILPNTRGGTQNPRNLVTVCKHCNTQRQDKPLHKFAPPEVRKRIRRQTQRSYLRYHSLAKALLAQNFSTRDIRQQRIYERYL